jgi:hypothetical protein
MDNSDILNNDVFISVYVIAMFFLPIFFIFSLTTVNLSKSMVEFITIVVFLALTIILLILCITKITDAVSMSNYLTIIFITMFIIPLFTLSYYSSINTSGQAIGGQISVFWKLFGNLMTIGLIICVVFMNLITSGAMNYQDAIPNPNNVTKDPFIALIVIASFIGLGILSYILPLLFTAFKQWMLGPLPTVNAENIGASTMSGMAFLSSIIKDIWINVGTVADDFFKNIQKDIPTSEDKQNAFVKYGLLYGFIFMIGVILYMAAFDPNALNGKDYVYTMSAIIPLVVLMGFVIPFSTAQRSASSTILLAGVFATIMFGLFYSYSSLSSTGFQYMSYFINFLIFLIVVGGLAIFFYIFGNYLKSIEGFLGFVIYFIFYIPCLLVDLFNYLFNEYKNTSRPIYALFTVEVLLILIYLYLPMILQYVVTKTSDNIVLLEKSEFLDSKKVIGNSHQIRMKTPAIPGNTLSDNDKYVYRKSYAISMWTYLNIQPPNNASYSSETTLFDYGNGKPKITYFNDMSSDKTQNKYIFYFTDSTSGPSSYRLSMPSQKWNYIVFNYYSDKVDLFINGTLERTFTFHNNMPNYLAIDNIITGSDSGLDGAICNVNYYTAPITKTKISNTYNLLMAKNPPTFSEY